MKKLKNIFKVTSYMWILFFIAISITLLLPNNGYSWSPLPVWSGWDGSTYWTTEMPIDAPNKPTEDQFITTWDNETRLSDELRTMFMFGKIIEIGAVWKNGKLSEDNPPYYAPSGVRYSEMGKKTFKIIEDIAQVVWAEFKEEIICVFYYPQFKAFSVRLHPDKWKDKDLNAKIAKHLESMRVIKYKEFFGE